VSLDLEVFGPDRPGGVEPPEPLADKGVVADGPFEVEDEDLPAVVAPVLLTCRWTVQISFPAGLSSKDLKGVERFARGLAEASGGVLYNPQSDDIVWPRGTSRLREPGATRDDDYSNEETELRLEWLLGRGLTSSDGDALLDILERRMPEALPRRFGLFEPLQGRLERDGRGEFTALWNADETVAWKGTRPFDWGFASPSRGWGSALTPEERIERTPVIAGHKAPAIDSVELSFQADVAEDPRWCDALAEVFGQVATVLSPFFAAAFMRLDENFQEVHLMGRHWLGIPDAPFWLVWVGEEYCRLLRRTLPPRVQRIAVQPTDFEALRRNAISWPAELVRQSADQHDLRSAAAVIPEL